MADTIRYRFGQAASIGAFGLLLVSLFMPWVTYRAYSGGFDGMRIVPLRSAYAWDLPWRSGIVPRWGLLAVAALAAGAVVSLVAWEMVGQRHRWVPLAARIGGGGLGAVFTIAYLYGWANPAFHPMSQTFCPGPCGGEWYVHFAPGPIFALVGCALLFAGSLASVKLVRRPSLQLWSPDRLPAGEPV